jgi:hypothetical protein
MWTCDFRSQPAAAIWAATSAPEQVQEKVAFSTSVVTDLAFAALSHPKTSFAGLQKLLQHKWHLSKG